MSSSRFRRDPLESLPLSERFRRSHGALPGVGAGPSGNRRAHQARAFLEHLRDRPPIDPSLNEFLVREDQLDRSYVAGQRIGLVRQAVSGDTVPPTWRPLAGALQNNRGHAIKVAGGATGVPAGFNQVVVETPKDNGEDAESLAVTLGWNFVDTTPDAKTAVVVQAIADLTWGGGGVIFNAQVDWLQGTTFTIPASYLRVAVLPLAGSIVSSTVAFGAAIAYGYVGNSGASSPARLTINVADTLIPAAASTILPIPHFATAMNLAAFPSNAFLQISFSTVGTGLFQQTVDVNGLSNAVNLSEQAIPLPNGARFFRITNLSAFNVTDIRALFNIAL